MDLKEIKLVIDLMTKNSLSEFELEKADFKIRIKKTGSGEYAPTIVPMAGAPVAQPQAMLPAAAPASAAALPAPASVVDKGPSYQIVSPMVGTFYLAPSPDSQPYVQVGQEVKEDTVVCIIEAMKVMNEIKAEVRGIITEIVAQNGKPVEFGKPLFSVKPLGN